MVEFKLKKRAHKYKPNKELKKMMEISRNEWHEAIIKHNTEVEKSLQALYKLEKPPMVPDFIFKKRFIKRYRLVTTQHNTGRHIIISTEIKRTGGDE